MILVPCVVLWFEQVWQGWTTPNSWEITLWSLFPLELSDSRRFGRVEPPRTHGKLHHTVVRGGSARLNRPELMSSSTPGLVPFVVLCYKQVRQGWTTPNSWEIILWSLYPLELSGSRTFGRVEPPRTHVKLTAGLDPCVVLWFKQVRKSWPTLNTWEIILWSLFPLELSGSRRFSRVESLSSSTTQWFKEVR